MYSNVFGTGATTYRKIIKIYFDKPIDQPVKLKAWDDENKNSTTGIIFTGTDNNGHKPLLIAVDTDADDLTDWWKTSGTSGGNFKNRLKGDEMYVEFLSAKQHNILNIALEIPDDLTTPLNLNAILTVEYSYSGDTPNIIWYYNIGSEIEPIWRYWDGSLNGLFGGVGSNESEIKPIKLSPLGIKYAETFWIGG